MRIILALSVLALMTGVGSVSALPIVADGLNTDSPYGPASPDIEGEFNAHDQWTDGDYKVLVGPTANVPEGWRYAQQDWNGEAAYDVQPDLVLKSEGDASMKMTHTIDYIHQDIFAGVWLGSLTPGLSYDIAFDFQADAAHEGYNGYPIGSQTGDDYHWSASWQVALVDDSPQGWGSTEDYPGHETGSTWIQPDQWDGAFHTQTGSFVALAPEMAFVLKYRAMGANGNISMRLDNLIVTPEPASLALLALGGLFVLRRKNR